MKEPLTREAEQAVARLFQDAYNRIYKYCYALTGGQGATADDLLQEGFYAIAEKWSQFAGQQQEQQEAWIRRVCHNKWRSQQRRQAVAAKLMSGFVDEKQLPRMPEEIVVHQLVLERCLQVILAMPPARQEVALLRWVDRIPPGEVAALLGIAPATVRSHLRQARQQLLEQCGALLPRVKELDSEPEQRRRRA